MIELFILLGLKCDTKAGRCLGSTYKLLLTKLGKLN